jgi:hypothetical protein
MAEQRIITNPLRLKKKVCFKSCVTTDFMFSLFTHLQMFVSLARDSPYILPSSPSKSNFVDSNEPGEAGTPAEESGVDRFVEKNDADDAHD